MTQIPPVRPEWRTSTVAALCLAMRETQDFGALPILADALQDAGCDDEALLARLRAGAATVDGTRLVAIIYSEETRDAVVRVETFAAGLGPDGYDGEGVRPDYRFVMEAADQWVRHGEYTTQYGDDDWRNTGVPDWFWIDYALILGKEPEWGNARWEEGGRIKPRSFFSCSC